MVLRPGIADREGKEQLLGPLLALQLGRGQGGVECGQVAVGVGGFLCLGFSARKGLEQKQLLGLLLALQLGEVRHDDDEGGQVALGFMDF